MQVAAAALTLLASVGLTYFLCLRPMRRGRGCGSCLPGRSYSTHVIHQDASEDLRLARAELAALRAAMSPSSESAPELDRGRLRTLTLRTHRGDRA